MHQTEDAACMHHITPAEQEHLVPLLESTPNLEMVLYSLLLRLKGNSDHEMVDDGISGNRHYPVFP